MKTKFITPILTVIQVVFSLFTLVSAIYLFLEPTMGQNFHLLGALAIVALMSLLDPKQQSLSATLGSVALLLASLFVVTYVGLEFDTLIQRIGYATSLDLAVGYILLFCVLEAVRRTMGMTLVIMAILSLLFAYLGGWIPGFFGHPGIGLMRLIPSVTTYLSAGVYGSFLEISATMVAQFMILGGLLQVFGGQQFILNIAVRLGRNLRAGPAQAAVISSCMFGSISGSAVANVVGTGTFTIPLMKSIGIRPTFAGAVEAAASTGGIFMPPVMGVAAFIMSGITGIPYGQIAFAALFPALLYYFSISASVHLQAVKIGIPKGMGKAEIRGLGTIMFEGFHLLIPMILLVVLLIMDYTPGLCASAASVTLILVAAVREFITNPASMFNGTFRKRLRDGFVEGARATAPVAVSIATLGIVAQALIMTGVPYKMVFLALDIGGTSAFLVLGMVALVCFVFGMGIPTTASYILVAVVAAPALTAVGIPLMAAHLFILYFTMIAAVTPPIGVAALVASRIADGGYIPTALIATRLALPGFIIPFMFAISPTLLLEGSILEIAVNCTTAVLGVFAFVVAFEGYLVRRVSIIGRILFAASGLPLLYPGYLESLAGLILFAIAVVPQLKHISKSRSEEGRGEAEVEPAGTPITGSSHLSEVEKEKIDKLSRSDF